MDLTQLRSKNSQVVNDYVLKKFKVFNGFTYSKKTRVKKCIQYYLAAEGSLYGQEAVETIYQKVFGQLFPLDEAEEIERKLSSGPQKVESSVALDKMENDRDALQKTLDQLLIWKRGHEYDLGETFFSQLLNEVSFVDDTLLDTMEFNGEFSEACKAQINSSVTMTKDEIEAKFDMLVGFEQSASCSFEAASVNWGVVNGKLEESFKAGLWANGGAKAAMQKLGFTAEVQAAIAIGAQLNLAGELKWSKGKGQLSLGGAAEVFVGARASGEAKISVSALKGLEASIKAGAFAGFSAEVSGSCAFSYDGKSLAKVKATAGVTFGAGAEFEASIKAPIFGPTKITFAASLSLGFGTSCKTEAELNFSEMALAASTEFRTVVYWRTLARGYEMTLMNQEARNLYYLNKSINRFKQELESKTSSITSFNKVPMEKRSLLTY